MEEVGGGGGGGEGEGQEEGGEGDTMHAPLTMQFTSITHHMKTEGKIQPQFVQEKRGG